MEDDRHYPLWLGIDLGGTNIKAGVVDDKGRPLSRISQPTEAEKGPDHGVMRICRAAREAVLAANATLKDIAGCGVGAPGPMDLREQILVNPHNLPGWINLPLAQKVGENLGIPAILLNDANSAAYGEFWVGVGERYNSLVQFTLGTGIGCGIVIEGIVLEGAHSHGGEAGHMRIALDHPRQNNTGLYGSFEAYASATSVVDRTTEALAAGQSSSLVELTERGEKLTSKLIFGAADGGDALAQRIVDQTAFYLAVGSVNLMHIINPDIVVFSGGMIAAGQPFLERIRHYIRENALPVPAAKTKVAYATLGTDAGFIGAAGCARNKFATTR